MDLDATYFTLYRVDLDALVQKLKLAMLSMYEQSNAKIHFSYFLELAFRLYKSVDYWLLTMGNLVNCDSAGPVPIGIVMRNTVDYEYL